MGVHGLWKLIEPSGQMVPLESLAGKVLAVDVSIWLHQAVKGVQDAHGAPLAVAHLLILFHRVCKLLFYKIKPVFVFDGGVPALKSQTMAARRQRSSNAKSEAIKVREKLIKNLLKHEALRHVLSDEAASLALGLNSYTLPGPSAEEDLYKLPPVAADFVDSECSDVPSSSSSDEETEKRMEDIHSIDVTSQEFLSLPAEARHDILTELIETRKQSSWRYLDAMPKKSDSFSDFQMNRLLKRHAVQTSLEKAEKEMGGRALSLKELEALLGDQGVLDPNVDLPSRRIAQDNITRYMLIQRDSENAPCQAQGEKFDIMNRLEDVGWSSESDTDVILQRSPAKGRGKAEKEPEIGASLSQTEVVSTSTEKNESCSITKQPKIQITEEVADILSEKEKPVKEPETAAFLSKTEVVSTSTQRNESCTISKQPKIRITEEVADILAALEDKDVNLKIDNSLTKINFQKNMKTTETEEKKTDGNEENNATEEKKTKGNEENKATVDSKPPVLDFYSKNQTEESDNCSEVNKPDEEIIETNVLNNSAEVSETKVEPIPETSISSNNIEDSSDSEMDFIAVENEEPEIDIVKVNTTNEPVAVPAVDREPLTLTINTAELGEKVVDDLFADVFEPGESHENKVPGTETTAKGDVDEEFRQQVSAGDLEDLKKDLEQQHSNFLKEKGKQERMAVNLTDQVYTDAQELLRLFGIPFVVAPMEAEAQCATLNTIGLTEGTITDDSDIWLFGGQVVYKNFFNQRKQVLEYRSENIQKYFKLTREELIKMALLVGSDYTVGLSGVGPVTALEIMAAFQTQDLLESLSKFRDWFTGAAGNPPRATLRKKIKNVVIGPGFPSRAVVEAYLHPVVDDSREPFSWAKPNLDLIRKYVRAKLGWPTEKCNELLLPVMKKLEENTSQTTLDSHFKRMVKATATEAILSKRVENAVKRLGSNSTEVDEVKQRKKRKPNTQTSSQEEEITRKTSKSAAKPSTEFVGCSSFPLQDNSSKIKLINEKLHKNVEVPQREMAQKLLEEKKKEAIRIFRTYKKGGKKKTKVYAKEEVKLSESSSDSD